MKRLTTEEWIKQAEAVHGNNYDYSNTVYTKATVKVEIICSVHGFFLQNPRNHIKGNGCPKCKGRGLTSDEWIDRFRNVHGTKFNYDKFKYEGIYTKSTITCIEHGDFEQNPHNHYNGQQCPHCSLQEAFIGNSYYNVTNANKHKEEWLELPCSLYLLKLTSEDEEFYKVGITNQDITRRFRQHDLPYTVELLEAVETSRYSAILLEAMMLDKHRDFKYRPNYKFAGYTECISQLKRTFIKEYYNHNQSTMMN